LGAYSRSDASIAHARADGVDAQIRTAITDDTTPIENGSRVDIFIIAPMARLREGISLNAGCDGDGPEGVPRVGDRILRDHVAVFPEVGWLPGDDY
jgi:hypothetical protein